MATEIARLMMAVDSSQVRGATRDLQGMTGAAGSLGKMLGGLAIGGTLAAMAKHVYATTAEFQKLHAQLVTVTGSAALAGDAFREIEQFATETPFQLGEVVQAFIKMKAMGLDPSMENLRAWGDLASANGKGILDTIQAVANATMGEAEMLKQYGIKMMQAGDRVTFAYKGVTTTVAKSSEAIEAHLLKLAKTNFAGGMQREMDTLGGAMSNLQDQVDKTSRAIGSAFAGQGIDGIRSLTKMIDEATVPLTRLAGDYSNLIDALNRGNGPLLKLSGIIEVISFNLQMMTLGVAGAKDLVRNLAALITQSGAVMTTAWWTREGQQQLLDRYSFGNTRAAAQDVKMSRFLSSRPDITKELYELGQSAPLTQQERIAAEAKRLKEMAGLGGGNGDVDAAAKATQSFIGSLREEIATLGMTETQLLRYKAALLGLSGNKEVQALIARKEAWNLEEKAIEDTVAALEDYAAKAKALGGSDTEKVLAEMAAFGPEAARGLMEYSQPLDEITDQYADLRQASLYWQQDFTDALVEMTFTGKNLWRDMVDAMLRDLARLAVQKNVTSPLFAWLGKIDWASVFGGGSSAYKTATAGEWWEEAFPTSNMANPSGMGGTMPMKAGPTGGAPVVNVAISVDQSGQVSSSADGPGAGEWQRSIKAMMDRWAQDEMRAGGLLSRPGAR